MSVGGSRILLLWPQKVDSMMTSTKNTCFAFLRSLAHVHPLIRGQWKGCSGGVTFHISRCGLSHVVAIGEKKSSPGVPGVVDRSV